MPMPTPSQLWLSNATPMDPRSDPLAARRSPRLVAAVAAIVAIAAERARAAGDLGALRDAIDRVLDGAGPPAGDPRDPDMADLPRIIDADPVLEEKQLRALLARFQPG
jgi:hypothetical protein